MKTSSKMIATALSLREYISTDQPHFESLNRAWIELNFEMEPIDVAVLRNPEEHIIQPGGAILMASVDGNVVGTAALKYVKQGVFEFTKMAVEEKLRGHGIGQALTEASIALAKKLGASTIILYSNRKLVPAISLYKKLGFQEVPVDAVYKRSDIKMEFNISK
jgi:N-acetylglutamate synthase-like GNAT family acetyltransferase